MGITLLSAPMASSQNLEGKELYCYSQNTKLNAAFYDDEAFTVLRQSSTDSDFYDEKYITNGQFPQPQGDNRSVILRENTRSDWRELDGARQYSEYQANGSTRKFITYQNAGGLFLGTNYPGIILTVDFSSQNISYSCKAVVYREIFGSLNKLTEARCRDNIIISGQNFGSLTGGPVTCEMIN